MPSYEDYKELLSSNPEGKRYYELLTLSHPDMSKVYRFVVDNVDLTSNGLLFSKANIEIDRTITSNDLDQSFTFTIGDIDNVLDDELELIPIDTAVSPTAQYQLVISDDLDFYVEDITFEVASIPQKKGTFSVITTAPDLSRDKTGEIYDYAKFPMLRTAGL